MIGPEPSVADDVGLLVHPQHYLAEKGLLLIDGASRVELSSMSVFDK